VVSILVPIHVLGVLMMYKPGTVVISFVWGLGEASSTILSVLAVCGANKRRKKEY
jgi:hypothetical protein